MEAIKITGKEFEKQYIAFGGFILIAKDMAPKKHSMIHVPDSVRDSHSTYMNTGVIVAKSPFKMFESESDGYWMGKLKKGDRVGFGASVPVYAPSPAFYDFEGDDKEKYITLHAKDVICIICETEQKKIELMERF